MEAWWPSTCHHCGRRGEGPLCRSCRAFDARRVPLALEGMAGVFALCTYEDPPAHVLKAAKKRADLTMMHQLAQVWATRMAVVAQGASAIVPAPSTRWSLFARGFSGAAVLAQALSTHTGLPLVHAFSHRGGQRQSSAGGPDERRRNLAGQIRAERSPTGRVLLVDDVLTTGSTAQACARELLGADSSQVWLACLCVVRAKAPTPLPTVEAW